VSAPAFLVPALPDGDLYTLDGPEGHHAATVQRLRVGEAILLGDGRGSSATATVTAVGKGRLELRLGERTYEPAPDPRVVVVQGIAKGDRGELAVQAMTEVGVDAIVPWAAARSIAKWTSDRARQRWVDTAREAAKQARRPWVPDVTAALSTVAVADYLRTAGAALVLHEEAVARLTTVDLPAAGEIVLVVGPEGGIAPEELTAYEKVGATPVRLGDTVLRTSTAGPAAIAVLSARLARW
jgi:16S rRNA (uracil1498-N3)-methyltransferase